jgi:hypothetical protein
LASVIVDDQRIIDSLQRRENGLDYWDGEP